MRRADERGMTLVELLIVVVLGGLILLAMYEVMITNQQTYAAQNADAQAQQTLRAGMNVLFGEIREISPSEGDIIRMDADHLTIRALRGVAIVCQILDWGNNPQFRARKVGDFLAEGDSVVVFFDNDPQLDTDDSWKIGEVDQLDTSGLTCTGSDEAQDFRLNGEFAGAPPDSIVPGAPVRSFEVFDYYEDTYDGESYLVRQDEDGEVQPLVGPLEAGNGILFEYLDNAGNTTANGPQVAQISVTLRTESPVRGPDGERMQDSLSARIFTRN